MIYLHYARLVILSQPKTGTTALDKALGGRAAIAMNNPPPLKHIQYPKFMKFVAPLIKDRTGLGRSDYEVVSVMREPADWLGSWYRYRTRDALKISSKRKQLGNYTGNVEFDEFVSEVLKPMGERPTFANIGKPCSVAFSDTGAIGCDRIYPYEDLSGLYELIEERTRRPLELDQLNVSPKAELVLSDGTLAKLKAEWAFAFDLHGSLKRDGSLDARFKSAGAASESDAHDDSMLG